jgi:hypothetical protein
VTSETENVGWTLWEDGGGGDVRVRVRVRVSDGR